MPITNNNYNFTNAVFSTPEQSPLYLTQPQAVITIVPNPGYTATVGDFTVALGFSDPAVQSITFAQSGLNVTCTVVFNTGFIMPSANYTIPLCITGDSEVSLITIEGKYSSVIGANITPASEADVVYSNSGSLNQSELLFTKTYTADSGYYLSTNTVNVIQGNQANYNIVETPTYNGSGDLTAVQYNFNYIYPNVNVSGDIINITASAKQIYSVTREVKSYEFDVNPINSGGELRRLRIFGDPDAVFTIVVSDSLGGSYNLETNSSIGSSGIFDVNVVFPSIQGNLANVTYSITLSGADLATPFNQPNPIVLTQYFVNPIITITGSSTMGVTGFTPDTVTGTPFESPASLYITPTWTLVINNQHTIAYNGTIDLADFEFTQPIGPNPNVFANVTNSSTVTVVDASDVLSGDGFNLNNANNQAPFQHQITNVSGNILTVTPNITATTSDFLGIFRTNGNVLENPSVVATQVNSHTIKFALSVGINRFGDNLKTFTLNLDNIIDVVNSSSPAGPYLISYDASTSADACCASTANYYLNSGSFTAATEIYTNANGATLASAGYYAASGSVRYWSGTAFTSTNPCSTCFTSLTLNYSSSSAISVCCVTSSPRVTRYVAANETFINNNGLYNNPELTIAASIGYYAEKERIQYREQSLAGLGILTNCASCP